MGIFSKDHTLDAAKYQADRAYQAQSETNATNINLQNAQNQFNEKMWRMDNEYNSAQKQRERLEAAGINPYMALEQIAGQSVSSGPVSQNSLPNQEAPTAGAQIMGNYYMAKMQKDADKKTQTQQMLVDSISNAAQVIQSQSSANLNDAQAALYRVDAQTRGLENYQRAKSLGLDVNRKAMENDLLSYQVPNEKSISDMSVSAAQAGIEKQQYEVMQAEAEAKKSKIEADLAEKFGDKNAQIYVDKIEAEIDNLVKQGKKLDAETIRAYAEKHLIDAQTRKTMKEAEYQGLINKITDDTLEYQELKLVREALIGNGDWKSGLVNGLSNFVVGPFMTPKLRDSLKGLGFISTDPIKIGDNKGKPRGNLVNPVFSKGKGKPRRNWFTHTFSNFLTW